MTLYTLKMKATRKAEKTILIGGVENLKEAAQVASQKVDEWVLDEDLGSSTFGYAFLFCDGELVACISYNGRVWTPEEYAGSIGEGCWYAQMMKKNGYAGEFRKSTMSKIS